MNFSHRYALSACAAAALALCAGCGGPNPAKEKALGDTAFNNRDYAKARDHYAKVVKAEPGNVDASVMLARSWLAMAEVEKNPEARKALADEGKSALAGVPEGNKADADVVQLQAQLAYHSQDYAAAAKLFRSLADDETLDAVTRSAGWSGLGVVDIMLSDAKTDQSERDMLCDRARTDFFHALRLDKRNAAARYHLGRLYRDTYGFGEAAIEMFEAFVSPKMMQQGIDERVQRVQHEFIRQLREEVAKRTAQMPGASNRDKVACAKHTKKADALFVQGKYKEAARVYEAALKSDPLDALAAKRHAQCLVQTARTDREKTEAARAYVNACTVSPKDVQLLKEAAAVAMRMGKAPLAARFYSRALAFASVNTRDYTVLDGLIISLKKAGRPKSAAVYQSYRAAISGPVAKR